MDLQQKLDAEKTRSAQFEQQVNEKQIELDCTKEQLEFVRAEADKNKVIFDLIDSGYSLNFRHWQRRRASTTKS